MRYLLNKNIILCSILLLTACSAPTAIRKEAVKRLATPAWMLEREIKASPFTLTAFERMHERNAPANLYIGGEGTALRTDFGGTLDPTPENPVALHLATRDNAENLIYLARPCQFSDMIDEDASCGREYWNDKIFSPEVMQAYEYALDNIKARYDITGFNLIGYDGGAAIAAMLAAKRDDVLSLRTVAGSLDHKLQASYLDLQPYTRSLNAVDFASETANMPQHHFIGGEDAKVPPAILHSYLQAVGATSCVQYTLVQEAEHERGWVENWPELLRKTPVCKEEPKETMAVMPLPLDIPQPIFYPRMDPSK